MNLLFRAYCELIVQNVLFRKVATIFQANIFLTRIAQVRKPGTSNRSSRASTPTTATPSAFAQSMPSFSAPTQGAPGQGGGFNFNMNAPTNPFQNFGQPNGGASGAQGNLPGAPPQVNGGSGLFGAGGNSNTPSFSSMFGSQPKQNGFSFGQQQNNGSDKSTTSFGGFGVSSQSQPKEGTLTPTTNKPSFSFGQQNGAALSQQNNGSDKSTTPFGGFGASGQSQPKEGALTPTTNKPSFSFGQQNGAASLNGLGQSQQPMPSSSSTIFKGFSQQTPADGGKSTTGGFANFGQSNGEKPATSNLFGGFGQSGSTRSQSQGGSALFAPVSQQEQTPKPTAHNPFNFGQRSQANGEQSANPHGQNPPSTGLFGSAPLPTTSAPTPKSAESVFSGQKPRLGGPLFTANQAVGKKPDGPSTFNSGHNAASTNPFGASHQNQINGTPQQGEQSAKPSLNIFGALTNPTNPQQSSQSILGQAQQDTSMTTPEKTPSRLSEPKQNESLGGSTSATQLFGTVPSNAPAKSLFDRITRDPPSAGTSGEHQGKGLFGRSTHDDSHAAHSSGAGKAASAPAEQSFQPVTQAPLFAPPANPFSKPAQPSGLSNSFTHSSSPDRSVTSQVPAAQQPSTIQSAQPRVDSVAKAGLGSEQHSQSLRALNEGLVAHLATQDPSTDWTAIMQYYLIQAAQLCNKPEAPSTAGLTNASTTAGPAPSQSLNGSNSASAAHAHGSSYALGAPSTTLMPSETSSTSKDATSTTPKASVSRNVFAQFSQDTPKSLAPPLPSTAPVSLKRPAEEVSDVVPATEKRARVTSPIEYPKLPANASETAKLFQATIEQPKPAATGVGTKPASSGFTPSFSNSTSGFAASSTASAGFLSAFGKKARDQEEKDREKRKAEDYDSDEETEEAWAERDKQEQEAKRKKIAEAAKSATGFVPAGALNKVSDSVEKPAPFGSGTSLSAEDATPTGSTPAGNGSGTQSASQQMPSLFGASAASAITPADASKGTNSTEKGELIERRTQGTGDNTWNPNTPIKFGGGPSQVSTTPAATPFSFGSNAFGSNAFGALAKNGPASSSAHLSASGFQFSGPLASSVSTPGASTPAVTDSEGPGEGTALQGGNDASDDAAPPEPQVKDQSGLLPEEHQDEDVVFSVDLSRASKWEVTKDADTGATAPGWVAKGKGPLYVLRHKTTGKLRVLLKVPPFGKPCMNFAPLPNGGYVVQGPTGKKIIGGFVDHFTRPPHKAGPWSILLARPDDAARLCQLLREAMPQ